MDERSYVYNRSIKLWLQDNDIEMYSTHEKRKSVVAERFMRILSDRNYKNMTLVSKKKYTDEVDDIVNK